MGFKRREDGTDITEAAAELAEEKGVDPASIEGSGADGRIVKDDVAAAAEDAPESDAKADDSSDAPAASAAHETWVPEKDAERQRYERGMGLTP